MIIIIKENSTINNTHILSVFKLDLPCINPGELICSTNILGKIFDDRYEKINIINTTEYENKTMNETIYLYVRYFIGFKFESIDKYDDYKSLITKENLPNNCASALNILFYIFLVILLSSSLLIVLCREYCLIVIFLILTIFLFFTFLIDFILFIINYICSLYIKSKLDIKDSDEYTNELIEILVDNHSINSIFILSISFFF